MSITKSYEWIEKEHRYIWFKPISWDDFVEFIGGDPNNPIWPGEGAEKKPLKNEPGKTSGKKWQQWWNFYWRWQEQFQNKKIPENLPDWAIPSGIKLSDDEIQYWMKHWKSFVSRHWAAWEKDGKPRPSKHSTSIEYNSIIAWGADPENPPPYVEKHE